MPTYKHPCPYCGKFIDKTVAACPYCAHADPFAPKRCPNCSKIVDDPSWVACPSCGASLLVTTAPDGSVAPGTPAAGTPAPAPVEPAKPIEPAKAAAPAAEPAAPTGGAKCSGCGSPLASGARFCTVCGTTAG